MAFALRLRYTVSPYDLVTGLIAAEAASFPSSPSIPATKPYCATEGLAGA